MDPDRVKPVKVPMYWELQTEFRRLLAVAGVAETDAIRWIVRRVTQKLNGGRKRKHGVGNYRSFADADDVKAYNTAANQNQLADVIESYLATMEFLEALRRGEQGILLRDLHDKVRVQVTVSEGTG